MDCVGTTGETMTSSFQYSREGILLDINNVSVSYGGKPIIKDFTASIVDIRRPGRTQGQIVGLLGPSGIGKTTIFKVISGLRAPVKGSVTIGPSRLQVSPGDVGVVAQSYPLLDHRTVIGNLIFAGKQTGLKSDAAREQAKAFLEAFSLSEHADKYPLQLSGGQRQRVAVAQQLICSKHYVVMDEPLSGLDVIAKQRVCDLILDIADRHEENTFIIVTHDVESAVAICDTIWLMGRDRDAHNNIVPGAKIVDMIDLIERDICWHESPLNTPQGVELVKEIKTRFLTL